MLKHFMFLLFLLSIYSYFYKEKYFINKITVISKMSYKTNRVFNKKIIDKYFIIANNAEIICNKPSASYYSLYHNTIYDDILFLIPLYNILVNTSVVSICNGFFNSGNYFHNYYQSIKSNFSLYKNCIYFKIDYMKLLHIHTNIFRNSKFNDIYKKLKNQIYRIEIIRPLCKIDKYSLNYSFVTTLFRRNNTYHQIDLIRNQSLPPRYIIVVHDRNFINFNNSYSNLIYIHTLNFQAGFYFRYLMALLSPEENIIIYDDDQNPINQNSHYLWIKSIIQKKYGIYSNRIGNMRNVKWCATPIIIKRKLLYIEWINDIYEPTQAEDGHLSFSALILCKISCFFLPMKGLKTVYDKLSSPRKRLIYNFWHKYVDDTIYKINSNYSKRLSSKYYIF